MRYNRAMTDALAEAPIPPESAAHANWRIAFLSILGFWLFYFLLNTIRVALDEEPGQLSALGRRTVVSLLGVVFTLLFCLVLRRFEHRSMRTLLVAAFLVSIPVACAYAATNYLAFYVVDPHDSVLLERAQHAEMHPEGPLAQILDQACSWYFFVVAWAVLYIALSYAEKVRQAERRAAGYRLAAQNAQRALRYQINPHFLFNTLNSLSTLVLCARNDEAERMIGNLSAFFRTSLTADPIEDVPLSEEIRMQRLYLDIEQTRFPNRLVVGFDIALDVVEAQVPGLILQPLVENAIKYGVSRTSRPVQITIRAHQEAGRLHLAVEDDGEAHHDPAMRGHGVGLRNVSERLAARFGAAADCRYGPRVEGGFRVDLVMPLV